MDWDLADTILADTITADTIRQTTISRRHHFWQLCHRITVQCLPEEKLVLEMLTESKIASGEHATQCLDKLFKLTDESSYYMAEDIQSDLQSVTEGSPSPLGSPTEQGNTSTPLSDAPSREDIGTTLSSVNTVFLSSPLNSPEMDSFKRNRSL
ncbi:hypothetical protein OIDMADRAFT_55889 [Oidiodendron maius Zn]|uniref:Uncharacterized protein n=1 Tax=Oidiodendron maius (strain Zn) TaxID=913774 RepID=A0A0C3CLU8_OIDMZ|nr:hypothetical protein OIDMADRAFT_55889 [Oidiodendron maius Zn]